MPPSAAQPTPDEQEPVDQQEPDPQQGPENQAATPQEPGVTPEGADAPPPPSGEGVLEADEPAPPPATPGADAEAPATGAEPAPAEGEPVPPAEHSRQPPVAGPVEHAAGDHVHVPADAGEPTGEPDVVPPPAEEIAATETGVPVEGAHEADEALAVETEDAPAVEAEDAPAVETEDPAVETDEAPPAETAAAPPEGPAPAGKDGPRDETAHPAGKQKKPRKGQKGEPQQKGKEKPQGPSPEEIVRRVGATNERALAYVLSPDPQLSRLSRKVREAVITDIPPVTAGALLGPAALTRHLIASAASGRYRDLFTLWDLFRHRPGECKPVLAERPQALEKARRSLETAVRLGIVGQGERVAQDISIAQGLIWQWLRDVLIREIKAVGQRPVIVAALREREPDLDIPLPEQPSERWLAEAAEARQSGELPPAVNDLLAANVDRLPATIPVLALAQEHYRDRVPGLMDRADLDSPQIGSIMAWARDHGYSDRLHERIRGRVEEVAARDRAEGLALWYAWTERGLDLDLPATLREHTLEGLDMSRPETAVLMARLLREGADIDPQAELETIAAENRQRAEKVYEAFVCAELPVTLPGALASNPIVRDGTRCEHCLAWTWVRPGHEQRCPQRRRAEGKAPDLVAAEPAGGASAGWTVDQPSG